MTDTKIKGVLITPTNGGRTSWLCERAGAALRSGQDVVFFNADSSSKQLLRRIGRPLIEESLKSHRSSLIIIHDIVSLAAPEVKKTLEGGRCTLLLDIDRPDQDGVQMNYAGGFVFNRVEPYNAVMQASYTYLAYRLYPFRAGRDQRFFEPSWDRQVERPADLIEPDHGTFVVNL